MCDYLQLISAILLITIDSIYLKMITPFFSAQIRKVQQTPIKINYVGAVLSYLFLVTGLNYFIIKPNKPVSDAFLLGIVIYGVYEATNYALLTKWNISTVIIDTLWGGILFAITTYILKLLRKL